MRPIVLSLLFFLPTALQAGEKWNVILPGGGMRFHGEIIAEACRVETSDRTMTIAMGQLRTNQLHAPGEDTGPVAFDIHLRECNPNVSKYVGISFIGIADGKNPDLLSIGEGPGLANGVGVAIFDDDDVLIPINSRPRTISQIYNGDTTLHLMAKYRATAYNITGGRANAQAWFSLTYE